MLSFINIIAAGYDNGLQLPGDIKEFYWGTVAFLVLMGLAIWKAGPSVAQAMRDRTARIEAELADARTERAEAEQALTAASSDLPDIKKEEERILSEARETAARLKDDLIARAETEAEDIRERGRADVANRKLQARADLTAEVSTMTRDAAEAVVVDRLDDASQSDLIESYISEVSQMT